MMGIEKIRMRRRPTRSIRTTAMSVKMKLATATERETKVGEEKPRLAKMVAEKYMRQF